MTPEAAGSSPVSHPFARVFRYASLHVLKRLKRKSDERRPKSKDAPLAQSVEQRPFKPFVPGSSPGGRRWAPLAQW